MPAGFDMRSFFLVAGDGWTESVLPFVLTSPTSSGTPAFIPAFNREMVAVFSRARGQARPAA